MTENWTKLISKKEMSWKKSSLEIADSNKSQIKVYNKIKEDGLSKVIKNNKFVNSKFIIERLVQDNKA